MQGTITAQVAARSRHRVPAPAPARFGGPGPTAFRSDAATVADRLAANLRTVDAAPCSRSSTSPSGTAPFARSTARRSRRVAAGSSGFLGPNGAGKTTTMRCIFGLATPDAGDGPLGRRPGRRRRPGCGSGTCPSSAASTRGCASLEQLAYFGQHHGLSRHDARTKSGEWLERFGLGDRAKSKLEDLSHGNQQRVQLATALVHDPELLVLDEPFSGLDPIGIATMAERPAGAGAGRASASCSVAPARPRRGGLRGRGDHQPRAGRRRGRDRGAQGALRPAPPRRRGRGHRRRVAGRHQPPHGPRARRRPRAAAGRRDARTSTGCSPPRRAAGEVRRFSYEPPKLSELFMEAVNAPQPTDRTASSLEGSREPPARDPPGRRAGDHRARPQPRLRPVARVHRVPAGRRVHRPVAAHRRATRRLALVGAAPAGARGGDHGDAAAFDVEVVVCAVPDRGRGRGRSSATGRIDAALIVPAGPVDGRAS